MGDSVLISFCNVSAPHLPLLGLFEPQSPRLSAVRLPPEASRFKGMTGIARNERYLYAVAQLRPPEGERFTSRSALLTFDVLTLDLISTYELSIAADAHSLAWSQGKMYVASSATDQIIELEMKGAEVVSERPYLQSAHGQLSDINHINGLCDSPDGLIMSAFGQRTDPSWASATNGFLMNVMKRERLRTGLQHPHTPFILDGSIVFCESRKTSVETVAGDRRQVLPGYTRGVCRLKDDLLVATSVGRKTSRSTGRVVENPGVVGVVAGGCTINRLKTTDFSLVSTFEAPGEVSEIYDLLAVDETGRWPVETDWVRESNLAYFAVYQGETPRLVQDPTIGSAVLLLSNEVDANRLLQILKTGEIRKFEGKQAVFDTLTQLPAPASHLAMDVRFDERGGFFPTRFVPLEQFRRG